MLTYLLFSILGGFLIFKNKLTNLLFFQFYEDGVWELSKVQFFLTSITAIFSFYIWEYFHYPHSADRMQRTPCFQVRAILCGSYVFGFYLQVILEVLLVPQSRVRPLSTQEEECKGLFEGLQTELEEVTEALAEVIARCQLTSSFLSFHPQFSWWAQALPENSPQDCDTDSSSL